jgi:hypothetical protein
MNTFRIGWYLIYTRPQHEKKVYSQLSTLKIDSFLPLTRKLRIWHDRKKLKVDLIRRNILLTLPEEYLMSN